MSPLRSDSLLLFSLSPDSPNKRNRANTPNLTLTLTTEPKLYLSGGKHNVTVTLTYNAESSARPITFKDPILDWKLDGLSFSLFHIQSAGYAFIEDHDGMFVPTLYDDPLPGETAYVAEDAGFVELHPGESYSYVLNLYPEPHFGEEFKAGERYAWRFIGGIVHWWSWGTKEELKDTPVQWTSIGPHFQPRLVVPPSEFMEIEVLA